MRQSLAIACLCIVAGHAGAGWLDAVVQTVAATNPPVAATAAALPVTNKATGWLNTAAQVVAATQTNAAAPAAASAVSSTADAALNLSDQEIASALKVALSSGVARAVVQLGQDGGFLNNQAVRIPMPAELQRIETALRAARQDRLADSFVATMNHAAEQAVVEAAPVFADAVTAMTWQDAQGILKGAPDAATQYLRRTAGGPLEQRFLPVVRDATTRTGVTAAYKAMQSAAPRGLTSFLGGDTVDVDSYVTRKATDGLFLMVAAEEQRIRANPLARTTDLLQRVFGSVAPTIQ